MAAHSPVKDSLEVFKQELRSGITELQGKPSSGKEKQNVQILDEGDFKCEVPGAYYFFIQAYEEKLKIWMDIVIVFLKNEQTLLRISCLAPSQSMENFYQIFNNVSVSVKFVAGGGTPGQTSTPQLGPAQTPAPSQPQVQPAPPATVSPQPQRQVTPPHCCSASNCCSAALLLRRNCYSTDSEAARPAFYCASSTSAAQHTSVYET